MNKKEIEIYREYLKIKSKSPKKTMAQIAEEIGINRTTLYQTIKTIEVGDTKKIDKCKEKARLSCLWTYKYSPIYQTLPRDREADTVLVLKNIIKRMKRDGFKQKEIATLLQKDNSTIIHHLK